jgi:hypothetical protein
MVKTLDKAIFQKGAGEAVLYGTLIGMVLSDVIPTPADALYFRIMKRNKDKLDKGEITPKQYWTRDAIYYYGLNPLWWSLVLGAVVFTKGDLSNKLKIGLAVIGGGVVVGVIHKNIEEENKNKQSIKK